MKSDNMMSALTKYIDKKMVQGVITAATNKNVFSYLDKDIVIGTSVDGIAIVWRDEELTKMAIGIIDDKDGNAIPLLALGAGSGNGDNRGYIAKGTQGLDMYYMGDLSAGEVGGIRIKADGIYVTHGIVVDEGLAGEFTINGTYWNEKLNELDMTTIIENPAKGLDIPSENILDRDADFWSAGGSENGKGAWYYNLLKTDLQMDAPLPTIITLDGNGIRAETTGDSGKYAQLDYRGLYINGGAIQIKGNSGTTLLDGDGIIASAIVAGTMTGMTIRTAASGERLELSADGIKSFDALGAKSGFNVDDTFNDIGLYDSNVELMAIINNLDGTAGIRFQGYSIGYGAGGTWYANNEWDFYYATIKNLTATFG